MIYSLHLFHDTLDTNGRPHLYPILMFPIREKKTCAPCGFVTATTHPHNRSQTLRRTPPLASTSCAPEETFVFALLLVERAGLGQKGLAPRRVSATRAETPYPQSFSRFFEARSPFLHLFVLRISRCRSSARLATHDLARLVLLEVCF